MGEVATPVERAAQAGIGVGDGGAYGPAEPGDYRGPQRRNVDPDAFTAWLRGMLTSSRAFQWPEPGDDVRRIPAGYTYLGQLVAHDLTDNSALCDPAVDPPTGRNLRSRALALDALYGADDAPERPWLAAIDGQGRPQRAGYPPIRFLLDTVERRLDSPPAVPAAAPARDIGRRTGSSAGTGSGVPLLADRRNDLTPVLSQLAALLKLAHNCAMTKLESGTPPVSPAQSHRNFRTARLALTYAYRVILRDDFLGQFLDPDVYAHYRDGRKGYLDEAGSGSPVSRDFADAAFRVGHAMVRPFYLFNNNEPRPRVFNTVDVLKRVSHGIDVPLRRDWIIDWGAFFEIRGSRPQSANLIRPKLVPALTEVQPLPDCAAARQNMRLSHRDLRQGASSRIRSIPSLLRQVRERLPGLAATSYWLEDDTVPQRALRRWAEQTGLPPWGQPEWVEELVLNPPPFFYYLVESAASAAGVRVGPLGSIVIADTIFKALNAPIPREADDPDIECCVAHVFGEDVPRCMSDLILWVDARLDADHKRLPGSTGETTPLPLVGRAT